MRIVPLVVLMSQPLRSVLLSLLALVTVLGGMQAAVAQAQPVPAHASMHPQAATDDCTPGWAASFGALDGVAGSVHACTVWDSGAGPELYAAGSFRSAGGTAALNIARWDGTAWSPLGEGLSGSGGGVVFALKVHDDGSGPVLYAGGNFETSGVTPMEHIARWDGQQWSAVGAGMNDTVRALESFAAGGVGAPKLYAGGSFTTAGGVPASRLAAWNGAAWQDVGGGVSLPPTGSFQPPVVHALHVAEHGSSAWLVAGGSFLQAGAVVCNSIARWDGTVWSSFLSGLAGPGVVVHAIASRPAGAGTSHLYVAGRFLTAGSVSAPNLARFRNNNTWEAVPGFAAQPATYRVSALELDASSGGNGFFAALHLDGSPDTRIARFTSTGVWSNLGSSANHHVTALHSDGSGAVPLLAAGGTFDTVGGTAAHGIAGWNGAQWSAMPDDAEFFDLNLEIFGDDPAVTALAARDDGVETALYAGGLFSQAPGAEALCIARWDGTQWSALGEGIYGTVHDIAIHDDGSGPAVYATGAFLQVVQGSGGLTVNFITRWNGVQWEAVGTGLPDVGYSLAEFDDGTGPALYVGGGFYTSGGTVFSGVMKWDGQEWSVVGTPATLLQGEVYALLVHDDGSGPHLFAAGLFIDATATPPQCNIARLHAGAWEPLAGGTDNGIYSIASHDDGTGPALYAGGYFLHAGGIPAERLARWKDGAWSAVNGDFPSSSASVWALHSHDDGSGPALYAGGSFGPDSPTDPPALTRHLARYDGSTWSVVGEGVNGPVLAFASLPGANGSDLYMGGDFTGIHGASGSYLARWDGVPPPAATWTDLGFALPGSVGAPLLVGTGDLSAGSAGALTLSNAAPSALSLLAVSLGSAGAPFKCGTLVPVPMFATFVLPTSGSGSIPLGWAAWPSGLSGLSLHYQFAINDAGALCGASLSNALRAEVP